jgi:hypothetical protein
MKLLKELIVLLVESPSFKIIVIGSSLFLGGYGAVVLFQENQSMQRHYGCAYARAKLKARDVPTEEDFCYGIDDVKLPWYTLPPYESLRYRMKYY